ncbi:ATP/GTP-binding protein [Motilibacter aurantiacus]|uniref:ATP/GTP-binding protein n=1 Tax=Motilibacter aurantiacus TaxID=2714955 RepID=UPI00140BAFDA|nr:ATP/GTP-binding protein [Motilibacter aurantiacus]NHC44756.1 ATP/GTP-binding protein [Motilibacter aurantiacus]
MGRRFRRSDPAPRPLGPVPGAERVEELDGEEWYVRSVTGAGAAKTYRCPGCDHQVVPGAPHLVAWPVHGGLAERRHWHSACWRARSRRRPSGRRP